MYLVQKTSPILVFCKWTSTFPHIIYCRGVHFTHLKVLAKDYLTIYAQIILRLCILFFWSLCLFSFQCHLHQLSNIVCNQEIRCYHVDFFTGLTIWDLRGFICILEWVLHVIILVTHAIGILIGIILVKLGIKLPP